MPTFWEAFSSALFGKLVISWSVLTLLSAYVCWYLSTPSPGYTYPGVYCRNRAVNPQSTANLGADRYSPCKGKNVIKDTRLGKQNQDGVIEDEQVKGRTRGMCPGSEESGSCRALKARWPWGFLS